MNPQYLPVIAIALVIAYVAARASAPTRRVLAVLAGCLAGYGLSISMNALFTDIMLWLTSARILPSNPDAPVGLSTGDIMTGLVVAGAGLGLVASMFIRDAPAQPAQQDSSLAAPPVTSDESY